MTIDNKPSNGIPAPGAAAVSVIQALDLQRDGHAVLPEINASFARGFTFQAWVRPDDLSRRTPIFALGNGVDVQALTLTGVAVSGDLELLVIERAGSQRSLVAPKVLQKGRWTHLAIVISEQGTARILKDGVELASAAKFSLPSPGSRSLGFLGRSLAPRGETLRGCLAEVRLFSRDLADEEIRGSKDRRLSGHEPDLVAYWPLDRLESGRLPDRSGRGRSARPVAAKLTAQPALPLTNTPAPSPALSLGDGASIVATSPTPRSSRALTLQTWVRPRSITPRACLLELADPATQWSLRITTPRPDGALALELSEKGAVTTRLDARVPVPLDQWTHLTLVLDPLQLRLFLNGVIVGAMPVGGLPRPGVPPLPPDGRTYTWRSLKVGGAIQAAVAEVRLFADALSESQIARSVRRTMLGTEKHLLLNWRLDEGRGATALNSGLLGNDPALTGPAAGHGTITGATWLQDSGLTRARPSDARPTRALALDGLNDHATLPGLRAGFGEGYTIETWVRPAALTDATILELCAWRGPQPFDRIGLQSTGADLQFVATRGNKPALRLLTAPAALTVDRWAHVAVVVHPSGLAQLVVDGQQAAMAPLFSTDEVRTDAQVARGTVVLGRSTTKDPRYLRGALAELRMWSRPLTLEELAARRFLRAAGTEPGLARCYHLDEPEGDTIADAGGGRHTGKLIAGACIRENPDLPLWAIRERIGAGVDATCKLMQDPRVDRAKGRKIVHVPVYEVVLAARKDDGAPDARATLQIAADEPVVVRLDRGDGQDLVVIPGKPAQLVTSAAGKARLTIDALGFKTGNRAVLRCPLLKVRTAEMPADHWDVITPDAQAHDTLTTVTGESLLNGAPARLGRQATRSPIGRKNLSQADADELAATVRGLMVAAGQGALEADVSGPMAFADADAGTVAIARSHSRGAAARITHADAPLRRAIPARRIPVPEGQVLSFAAGDPDAHAIVDITLLAAPGLVGADEEPQSFADGEPPSGVSRTRNLRKELSRLDDEIAGEILEQLEDRIEAKEARKARRIARRKLRAEKAEQFFAELKQFVNSAIIEPIEGIVSDIIDRARDALVVVLDTVDPKGVLTRTYQVVVDFGNRVVRSVIDSVEAAVDVMGAFFARVAARCKELVDYLAALFDWGDILETSDGLLARQQAGLKRLPGHIRTARAGWAGFAGAMEESMGQTIDETIRSLNGDDSPPRRLAPEAGDRDERSSFLAHKVEANTGALKLDMDLTKFDIRLFDQLKAALGSVVKGIDAKGIWQQLKASVDGLDLSDALDSIEEFCRDGASVLLLALKAALTLLIRMVKVAGDVVLGFAEQLLEWGIKALNERINIPFVTDFIEETILGGRKLTLLTLLSVIAAVPFTVGYKLAHGTDHGPFSAPASFADDADPKKTAAFNAEVANYINVSCSFVSSLIITVVDAVDNDAGFTRGLKLVSSAAGCVICGVAGFPTREADGPRERIDNASYGLQVTGWVVGLVGAVIGIADAAYAIYLAKEGKDDEDTQTVLAFVSGGIGVVQLALAIAGGAIDTVLEKRKPEDERDFGLIWLGASSNIMGGVVASLPMIQEGDEAKIRIGKGVVGGVLIMGQLATGISYAVLSSKAAAALDTTATPA